MAMGVAMWLQHLQRHAAVPGRQGGGRGRTMSPAGGSRAAEVLAGNGAGSILALLSQFGELVLVRIGGGGGIGPLATLLRLPSLLAAPPALPAAKGPQAVPQARGLFHLVPVRHFAGQHPQASAARRVGNRCCGQQGWWQLTPLGARHCSTPPTLTSASHNSGFLEVFAQRNTVLLELFRHYGVEKGIAATIQGQHKNREDLGLFQGYQLQSKDGRDGEEGDG